MSTPPPVQQAVDANSVDLVSGALTLSISGISIGQAGAGGLSYGRNFIGNGWRDSFIKLVNVSGALTTISIGGSSEAFTLSGSVYTSTTSNGATLTKSGSTYTYTARDGTVVTFQPSSTQGFGPWGKSQGRVTQIVKPDGETDVFTYQTTSVCRNTPCSGDNIVDAERLASYSNNLGYEIDLTYQNDGDTSQPRVNTMYQVAQATAVNYAYPSAAGMPKLTLSTSGGSGNATDALGRVQTFAYDTAGHLTSYSYPYGSTAVTLTYDGSGRVSTLTNSLGNKWTYAYSGNTTNQTATVTDPLGHTRTVVSNPSTGLISSDADGLGHVTRYTYDGSGRVLTPTTPNGIVTTLTYDGRGNVTQKSVTAAGGSPVLTTSATYDASCSYPAKCNQPNTTTDAKGAVTNYYYNNNTFLNTIVYPAGADGTRQQVDQTYAQYYAWYTQNGSLARAPSPVWRLNYASAGCPTAQTCGNTAAAVRVIPGYTASGSANNLLPISLANGSRDGSLTATTSISYDAVGNLYTTTDPLGNVTRYRYDVARQPIGVVGPDPDGSGSLKNRGLRYTYDGAGRVARVDRGSVASQSDADWANFTTLASQSATYDAIGHMTLASVGLSGSPTAQTQYTYDAAMRLTCTAVRMNAGAFGSLPASACTAGALGPYGPDRITYDTYDAANHLTKVTSGYGTTVQRDDVTTTFGYDGETLSQADAKGNLTSYAYDGFDRLIQVNFPSPAGGGKSSGSDFETYAYDANSNVTSERRRDGQTISYGYDARNRLTSGANGATYAYDTLGRVTSASISGQTTSYGWDALSRQVSETGPLGTVSRQFDLDGNRTRLTWPDGFLVSYQYDAVGEATGMTESTGYAPVALFYDDLGRTSSIGRSSQVNTYFSYGSDLHLSSLTQGYPNGSLNETYGFWYNAAGQVRSSTSSNAMYDWAPSGVGRNYAVDGQNRYTTAGSTSYGYDARSNLSSDGVNTYAYDVTNRLTSLSNGATLSYDAASRLFQTTGSSTTRFLYDGDQIIGEYDGSGNLLRRYGPGPGLDQPLLWYEGAGTSDRRFLLTDRQGSIIAVTSTAGANIGINTYDESGIPGSGNIGRFQYDAMPWIPEAGLYHDRARDYSPTLSRFMQPDPIGYGDGMNFFNFAHGDPVNGSDHSGLDYRRSLGGGVTRYCSSQDGGTYDPAFDDGSGNLGFGLATVGACYDASDGGSLDFGSDLTDLSSAGGNSGDRGDKTPAGADGSRSPKCPSGGSISLSPLGYGITGFLGVLGASFNIQFGVAIPTNFFKSGSLRGTQLYASGSATGLFGLGAFGGAGNNFGYAVSPNYLQTSASSTVPVGQAGGGVGAGFELSGQVGTSNGGLGDLSQGVSVSGSGGPRGALGAYGAGGVQTAVTVATPPFGCHL